MLYSLIKFPARIALHFYCRKLIINNKAYLESKGPLLIAANHPNSFLDAIIVDTLFKQPVTALTRGDVFKNKIVSKILHSLNMLPVYRVSEGVENLEFNYSTFDACNEIFNHNGIVLIFSEGGCTNEWHLRPLKKGTSRLALKAWQQGIPLEVLPLGINYSSFRKFGKTLCLNFGAVIKKEDIKEPLNSGMAMVSFNKLLEQQLEQLVFEIPKNDKESIKRHFDYPVSTWKKIVLFLPATLGYLVHFPLHYFAKSIVKKNPNDHYDSIIVGILFFLYPVFLLLIALLFYFTLGITYMLLAITIIPFSAWSLLQLIHTK